MLHVSFQVVVSFKFHLGWFWEFWGGQIIDSNTSTLISLDTGKVFPPNNFSFLVSTGHVIREKHSSQRAHYKDLCGNSPRVFLKLGEFQTLAFNFKTKCYVYLTFPLTVSNIKSLAMQDPKLAFNEVEKVIPFCHPLRKKTSTDKKSVVIKRIKQLAGYCQNHENSSNDFSFEYYENQK